PARIRGVAGPSALRGAVRGIGGAIRRGAAVGARAAEQPRCIVTATRREADEPRQNHRVLAHRPPPSIHRYSPRFSPSVAGSQPGVESRTPRGSKRVGRRRRARSHETSGASRLLAGTLGGGGTKVEVLQQVFELDLLVESLA